MEQQPLKRILEAALLASSQPLTLPQISGLFDEFDMPSQEALAEALEALQADCAERGVELVEVASGFRYQVRQDVHSFVSRLWAERQSRYSRALLETLSLIAYRQPITRAEIEQIRGVAVSTNIVRTLEEREWVRVVGYRDLPGKPALFGTTKQFLDYFNLKSLDQLPPLSEIRDLDDLDPQLALDGGVEGIPAILAQTPRDDEADGEPAGDAPGRAEPTTAPATDETASTTTDPSIEAEPDADTAPDPQTPDGDPSPSSTSTPDEAPDTGSDEDSKTDPVA